MSHHLLLSANETDNIDVTKAINRKQYSLINGRSVELCAVIMEFSLADIFSYKHRHISLKKVDQTYSTHKLTEHVNDTLRFNFIHCVISIESNNKILK